MTLSLLGVGWGGVTAILRFPCHDAIIIRGGVGGVTAILGQVLMGLLPDTTNGVLRLRRECPETNFG